MTVSHVASHHDATSSDQACDSVGSEASTASNQMDSVETAAISQQLDLSTISNYLSQSRSLQNAEIQPEELEIVHQQLAVQALKRGDFKAVAQITAWMAQNQQRKTNLLPPLSKEEYALSSTADLPTVFTPVKGDGAGFLPTTASQSARFDAVQELNTEPSIKEQRIKGTLQNSKQSDVPENKFGSGVCELVSSIAVIDSERIAVARGSSDTLNESRNRKDKKHPADSRQNPPKMLIGSRPDSETPSPPSSGSAAGAGATSETRKGSL
jgi:hypothetical protein